VAIIDRHIQTAATLIAQFDFKTPFHHFLNNYFARNKQMGGKDRRTVREACYAYFRFGHLLQNLTSEEKIRLAFWGKGLIEDFPLAANAKGVIDFIEKAGEEFNKLFPCDEQISNQIEKSEFAKNHLEAGTVFFRKTKKGLQESTLLLPEDTLELSSNLYAVKAATSLNILSEKGWIQIQDKTSQEICQQITPGSTCWDVCAGAGGKTLHLQELFPDTTFFVSDVRTEILENLQKRAISSGHSPFLSCQINLEDPISEIQFSKRGSKVKVKHGHFDSIVADVPCTGSGVWRRTPENLISFDCWEIARYANLQENIVKNASKFLKLGGHLHYITCSVFEAENEGHNAVFEQYGLTMTDSKYFNSQESGGDVLYYSCWEKG